jgi:hypothetical protein
MYSLASRAQAGLSKRLSDSETAVCCLLSASGSGFTALAADPVHTALRDQGLKLPGFSCSQAPRLMQFKGELSMAGLARTIGVALLGTFAVPVAGVTGIAAMISALILVFSSDMRSFGLFVFMLIAAGVCYFAIRTLQGIQGRSRSLIENINLKESLELNPANLLGFPSPAFFAFDKVNRTLAICNGVTGDYKLYPFEYVMQWYYEWGTGTRMDVGITGGQAIPGTVMREPTITHTEYKKNFTLVLEVSDENNPLYKFPMQSEDPAKRWCAKLNAIFNGSPA